MNKKHIRMLSRALAAGVLLRSIGVGKSLVDGAVAVAEGNLVIVQGTVKVDGQMLGVNGDGVAVVGSKSPPLGPLSAGFKVEGGTFSTVFDVGKFSGQAILVIAGKASLYGGPCWASLDKVTTFQISSPITIVKVVIDSSATCTPLPAPPPPPPPTVPL